MSESTIPILDLMPEIEALWEPIQEAITRVLKSGRFILGPEVEAFENEAADYLGVKHAVGVNSGTDALVIALRALGVGPGDEVITSPFTFVATAEAIATVGAKPVFVDIDPASFNLDASLIEAAITANTKAIIPVHLFGQASDMDAIMAIANAHGLKILEDVAQAFGEVYRGAGDSKVGIKKVGAIGDAGAYSFFPSKNLGAFGDGGLVVTDSDALASNMRMLRAHGSHKQYHHEAVGYNSRLDAIQAAILRVKLEHVDRLNDNRRQLAARYNIAFADFASIEAPSTMSYAMHVFHQYTIRVLGDENNRDRWREALAEAGVHTMVYYPVPIHRMPMYGELGGELGPQVGQAHRDLPHTEAAAAQVLSLPISPTMDEATQDRIIAAIGTLDQTESR